MPVIATQDGTKLNVPSLDPSVIDEIITHFSSVSKSIGKAIINPDRIAVPLLNNLRTQANEQRESIKFPTYQDFRKDVGQEGSISTPEESYTGRQNRRTTENMFNMVLNVNPVSPIGKGLPKLGISNKVNPLLEEAKKYKTAEEFIYSDLSEVSGFKEFDTKIRSKLGKDKELIGLQKEFKKTQDWRIWGSGDKELGKKVSDLWSEKYFGELTSIWNEANKGMKK